MSEKFERANNLRNEGKYDEAVEIYTEAIDIFIENDLNKNAADAYVEIAESFEALGNYLKARVAYHRARKYYKKAGYMNSADEISIKLQNVMFFTGGFQISRTALIFFILTLALAVGFFIVFIARGIDFNSADFPIFMLVISILVGLNLATIYIDRYKRKQEEEKEERMDLEENEI